MLQQTTLFIPQQSCSNGFTRFQHSINTQFQPVLLRWNPLRVLLKDSCILQLLTPDISHLTMSIGSATFLLNQVIPCFPEIPKSYSSHHKPFLLTHFIPPSSPWSAINNLTNSSIVSAPNPPLLQFHRIPNCNALANTQFLNKCKEVSAIVLKSVIKMVIYFFLLAMNSHIKCDHELDFLNNPVKVFDHAGGF